MPVTANKAMVGVAKATPTSKPFQVVEIDPKLGELPGLSFGSREEADDWCELERRAARLEEWCVMPRLVVREVKA